MKIKLFLFDILFCLLLPADCNKLFALLFNFVNPQKMHQCSFKTI